MGAGITLVAEIMPKEKSFVRYLAGGTIFGLGWALSGACPGPIVVNIGYGFFAMISLLVPQQVLTRRPLFDHWPA